MKLHNTLTGTIDQLTPLDPNNVRLYACGLTVYSQPHIGNWVAYIYWDLLVRTLRNSDYNVTHIQNITDVGHLTDDGDAGEDKMQKRALKEGKTAWDVAEKYIAVANHEAFDVLGLVQPTYMPRATEYIDEQIAFVQELEQKGFTYAIDDGVYFDTSKLASYGELAHLDISGLRFGARVADSGKKNPTDFALWKLSDPNEKRDMKWESPWGVGFPGWHLECSVMSRALLGEQIDIHTGGIDHIPVHHTNEIAQSESVSGKQFASTWLHANHIKVNGTKMSKSLGNIYTLQDITDKGYSILAFKLLVLGKHYQTEGNFTWDILEASNNRLQRWRNIAALRWQTNDTVVNDENKDELHDVNAKILSVKHAAHELLSNNLRSPEALALIESVFDTIDKTPVAHLQQQALIELFEWIESALGLPLLSITPDIPDEAKMLLTERAQARRERDWQKSDDLRDTLNNNYSITTLDKQHGSNWVYQ